MKDRLILVAAFLLISFQMIGAQDNKVDNSLTDKQFEITFGFGGAPLVSFYEYPVGAEILSYEGPHSAQEMYDRCYDASYSMAYSLEFAYHMFDRWDLCSSMGLVTASVDRFDPFTDQKLNHEDLYTVDFQVGARRYHKIKDSFRFYSQATIGASFYSNSDFWDIPREYSDSKIPKHLAFQITALGLSFGHNMIGSVELGWGTEYIAIGLVSGIRMSLGYRF